MLGEHLSFPALGSPLFPMLEDEPEFDPDRHLALEMPRERMTLAAFGYDADTGVRCPSDLALTSAFSILSDAGVEALRQIGRALLALQPRTEGNPDAAYIKPRACAYSSRFIQSLWSCPRLNELLSEIARTPIAPHSLPSAGLAFIYAPEDPAKTNQGWHLDSIGFACVIALNDPSRLQGGGFQYFRGTREEVAARVGGSVADLRTSIGKLSELPGERIDTLVFPRAGHGVFMQGNMVLHRGEPLRAKGERMMFVPGFISLDMSYPDATNWNEIRKWNSPTMRAEYARHKAWRAKAMLAAVIDTMRIDEQPGAFKQALEAAIDEIREATRELPP